MRRFLLVTMFFVMMGGLCWRPVQAQYALGPNFYDSAFNVGITYSGTWTHDQIPGYIEDTRSWTSEPGSAISINIWGGGFSFYTYFDTFTADINICIDTICSLMDTFGSGSFQWVSVDGLTYGEHAIQLVHSDASGKIMYFDAILIHPPAPQPTLPPQQIEVHVTLDPVQFEVTPEAWVESFVMTDSEDTTQTVAFSYSMDAGDVLNGVVSLGILFLLLVGLLFWYWNKRL